jgi:hypothetical protein
MSANIGGLINTLWIGTGNKEPVNIYFIMKNKVRVMSFKLKEQKQLILAVGNLHRKRYLAIDFSTHEEIEV